MLGILSLWCCSPYLHDRILIRYRQSQGDAQALATVMFTHLSPHSALHLCFIFCGQRIGKYRQPKGVCAISTDFCLRFKHWDYILGGQKREGEEKGRCIDSKKFLYALALDYFLKRHWNPGTILAGNNGTVKQSVGVCSVNFVKENYDKNIFINDLNTINMQYCWQYIV